MNPLSILGNAVFHLAEERQEYDHRVYTKAMNRLMESYNEVWNIDLWKEQIGPQGGRDGGQKGDRDDAGKKGCDSQEV
jgi:hypothetical protein